MNKDQIDKVWIVFTSDSNLLSTTFLHKDYKHCFLFIKTNEGRFVLIDPKANGIDIKILEKDLNEHYFLRWLEYQIGTDPESTMTNSIECPVFDSSHLKFPISFFTCVEIVKRILGIYSPKTVTPYQLYKLIKKLDK